MPAGSRVRSPDQSSAARQGSSPRYPRLAQVRSPTDYLLSVPGDCLAMPARPRRCPQGRPAKPATMGVPRVGLDRLAPAYGDQDRHRRPAAIFLTGRAHEPDSPVHRAGSLLLASSSRSPAGDRASHGYLTTAQVWQLCPRGRSLARKRCLGARRPGRRRLARCLCADVDDRHQT